MNSKKLQNYPFNMIVNLLMVYVCYEICRITFLFENWSIFGNDITWKSFAEITKGGLLFDSAAIVYTNSLYLLLVLFPLHFKEIKVYREITKWVFVFPNAICIIINLMDAVYFSYTQHRTSAITFNEFKNENNLGSIFGIELFRHWYLLIIAVALILFLVKCYRYSLPIDKSKPLWKYYVRQVVTLAIVIPFAIMGIRGESFSIQKRPISVSNAHQYVNKPIETGIVLNTTFSIIRTIGENPMDTPRYFISQTELDNIYSPIHYPSPNAVVRKKNVVVLIVESFAQEFIGILNKQLDGGTYKGYTTFTDSLIPHCTTFEESFSNSSFSIDAVPSLLASIPRMDRPFVLSPFSLNDLNSMPSELNTWGYYTAFFHGASNGSLGIQSFVKAIGFKDYFGRTEFDKDPRFRGEKDYDGTWGIWDEPFLQYFCTKMNEMKQPFLTSVFTLSSHHPFNIPAKYKNIYKDEGLFPLHKCVRYTDNALRHFFATAKKQPWYKNTIFVISADHASFKITHNEYKTELGRFRIPIIIYDPSGEIPAGQRKGIIQQIDVMPTILSYLGYNKPYIAFGKDVFNMKPEDTWAVNWDHIIQFIKGGYLMQFDGKEITGIYQYSTDRLLKHNLKGKLPQEHAMEKQLEAVIQSYIERAKSNKMALKNNNKKK